MDRRSLLQVMGLAPIVAVFTAKGCTRAKSTFVIYDFTCEVDSDTIPDKQSVFVRKGDGYVRLCLFPHGESLDEIKRVMAMRLKKPTLYGIPKGGFKKRSQLCQKVQKETRRVRFRVP